MQTTPVSSNLLSAVADLFPAIAAAQAELDATQRLPTDLIAGLADAGVFNMSVPRALGGLEVDPLEMIDVIERLSWADGAVGWIAAIASGTAGYISARLSIAAASSIWSDARTVMCGNMAMPGGIAVAVDGGFRVTGRWAFGSGSYNSDWLASACTVQASRDEGAVSASPAQCILVLRRQDCELLDTWDVVGLRGTGSTDYAAHDVFVPTDRSIDRAAKALHDGALYRHRFYLLAHAAHALGVAHRSIDTFRELALVKPDGRSDRMLAGRAGIQSDVAQAHALVAMAGAYLREVVRDAWATVSAGASLSLQQQGAARLAIVSCVRNSVQAIDLLYEAAGASSIYETSPLARCFRDIHVASQHAVVQKTAYAVSGQTILDVTPTVPFVL